MVTLVPDRWKEASAPSFIYLLTFINDPSTSLAHPRVSARRGLTSRARLGVSTKKRREAAIRARNAKK